jgi:restriction system protein
MNEEKKPKVKERGAVFIKAALETLKEAGGSLPFRDVKAGVAKRVKLDSYDKEVWESGIVSWEGLLHFYSIACVKAGFIRKHAGLWHLTPEGEAVIPLPANEILDRAVGAYREWKARGVIKEPPHEGPFDPPVDHKERSFVLERAQSDARAEIEDFVRGLGPYDFQELVAALLRGMGYTTSFVAPKGPDGGTDILAYPDPIGAKTPHIRVQVKHRSPEKATREEIAALRGIIRQDREIGLFVSSAGFTADAVREARQGGAHIELIDLNGFLEQWTMFYDKLSEDDKGNLRLRRVYFLAPE